MARENVRDDFLACVQGRTPAMMPLLSLSNEFHQRQAGVTDRQARLDVDSANAGGGPFSTVKSSTYHPGPGLSYQDPHRS